MHGRKMPQHHQRSAGRSGGQSKVQAADWVGCCGELSDHDHKTAVQYEKSFSVLSELLTSPCGVALSAYLQRAPGFRFLDLGAAPGGFSGRLLSDPWCSWGVGVTLPPGKGFPLLLDGSLCQGGRYLAHFADLLDVGPYELASVLQGQRVDLCLCDGQNLAERHGPTQSQWSERGAWDRFQKPKAEGLGIWSLLFHQLGLSLSQLEAGGCLLFRFSWVLSVYDACVADCDRGYYETTMRLMFFLSEVFGCVEVFKSSEHHTSDSTCYLVCRSFIRSRCESLAGRQIAGIFARSAKEVLSFETMGEVPMASCLQLLEYPGPATVLAIGTLLEKVTMLRDISRLKKGWSDGKRYAHVTEGQHSIGKSIGQGECDDSNTAASLKNSCCDPEAWPSLFNCMESQSTNYMKGCSRGILSSGSGHLDARGAVYPQTRDKTEDLESKGPDDLKCMRKVVWSQKLCGQVGADTGAEGMLDLVRHESSKGGFVSDSATEQCCSEDPHESNSIRNRAQLCPAGGIGDAKGVADDGVSPANPKPAAPVHLATAGACVAGLAEQERPRSDCRFALGLVDKVLCRHRQDLAMLNRWIRVLLCTLAACVLLVWKRFRSLFV